ncbi:MAG: oligosaccharide flippase family protein [Nostocaceae cyanobacterium]|nr:oligosaccharide flippase family protein [Nostocaceae cyanobacterium]
MKHIGAKKIAGSSLWLTGSFMLAKVSQLIAQVFLARLLTPQDFGIWGMVLIVTTLSALFKDGAIATVLVQRGLDDKKLVDAVYSLGINISVVMFVLQALTGFPLALFFGEPLVFPLTATVALVFLIGAGAGSHGAVLQRQMKFRELAIADGIAGVARFASLILFATLGYGVWSFVIAEIAMTTMDALLKRYWSGYRFTYYLIPERSAIREVQAYITSLIGIHLAVYANTNSDNLIIGRLLGSESLGYYNLAYQLAMLPTYALSQINNLNFSVLSQKDNQGQKAYLCKILELYALLYAPLYGVAFVVAPGIIPLVYGHQWKPAVSLFQIILIFAYARGFMSILGTTLNAVNKPNINAAINWVLVPLSMATFFLGAKFAGVTGVAIAVAIFMGICATIWFWFATSRATNWNIVVLLKPVLLPTIAIAITLLGLQAFPLPIYLQTIFVLVVYGGLISVFSCGRIKSIVFKITQRF